MADRVLMTGGAGFIGSHLVDALVELGHEVVVFDALVAQVHGGSGPPTHLNPDAELVIATFAAASDSAASSVVSTSCSTKPPGSVSASRCTTSSSTPT